MAKHLITSALPYVNGVKHLGNLVGSLLPADVYARYLRFLGHDVVAVCGTDDHGTPAEISAIEANLPVEEYVTKMYKIQKQIYEDFGLSFNFFGQTSTPENTEITQSIFLNLYKNGYIFEKKDKQLYSIKDKRFLPDRYVIGTCPHCGYERARGDQCEGCSTLLDPTELLNPRSNISGSTELEVRETLHLYIDLPKIQPKVEKWIDSQTGWPATTLSTARKWLDEGLRPRGITRNLKWGIPVPLEGYEDLVFYVWFDAPIGYIAITKQWANSKGEPDLWKEYWKNPETTLTQFMGIDNVPFHTVTWPCSLIGADDGYILAKNVKSFQWLTYEKGKFSTSQNRGIFTDKALELYPADYWRYYLLLIAPERQDTDFQWKSFQNAVNNDLNNLLGNLVNRVVTFSEKHFSGKIPEIGEEGDSERALWTDVNKYIQEYRREFDAIEFQKPIRALRKILQVANKYFQESRPWETIKEDKERTGTIVSTIAHLLRILAILYTPIIPFSTEKIYSILGIDGSVHSERWDDLIDKKILVGNSVNSSGPLFTKIQNKEIDKLIKEYGGAEESKKMDKKKKKEEKKAKKEKKKNMEKNKKQGKKYVKYEDFAQVELRTAEVLKVEDHPNADSLLVLTLDDGERKDRTVCAGIKEHYTKEDLLGKRVIIVHNLKPKKLRGIKSEGMVLAVEDENGVSLLRADRDVPPGLEVH